MGNPGSPMTPPIIHFSFLWYYPLLGNLGFLILDSVRDLFFNYFS